jgi:hypothetical protein
MWNPEKIIDHAEERFRPDGQGPFTCTRASCGAQSFLFAQSIQQRLSLINRTTKKNGEDKGRKPEQKLVCCWSHRCRIVWTDSRVGNGRKPEHVSRSQEWIEWCARLPVESFHSGTVRAIRFHSEVGMDTRQPALLCSACGRSVGACTYGSRVGVARFQKKKGGAFGLCSSRVVAIECRGVLLCLVLGS